MYQRILIATDGSTLSRKAVDSGLSLAELTSAQVVALKVVPRYPVSYFEGGMAVDLIDVATTEKHWAEAALAVVNAVKVKGEARGVKVKTVTHLSDTVGESIIATAKKHKCDLIVMASHGRRGIQRVLMGSATQHVLTHSHIAVLVLR